jgi:hypothetical protein
MAGILIGTLLELLVAATPILEGRERTALYHVVKRKVKRDTGVNLPYQLVIPYPAGRNSFPRVMKETLTKAMIIAGYPEPLRHYYLNITRFVGKRGDRVADLVCSRTINIPSAKMKERLEGPCNCKSLDPALNRVEGCVVVRDEEGLRSLLGDEDAAVLMQNCMNGMLVDWEVMEEAMERMTHKLITTLPNIGTNLRRAMRDVLMRDGRNFWDEAREECPKPLDPKLVDGFAERHPDLVFLQLDKNAGNVSGISL